MSNLIKIKRAGVAGTATPASLAEGELAYSENSKNLFIGTNGGVDVQKIGGNTDVTKLATIETNADVTDATNVAAAGAVMESDTTTALMQFVIDEDTMTSNLATKVPTQQSVKAYVDTNYQPLSSILTNTTASFTTTLASNIATNNAKVSNVSTALSTGTVNATTYGITSDGGANDVVLVSATATLAGLLTAAKFNEIGVNTAKVSNVPTQLSTGTVTSTTYGITSDGGTDDVVLASASGTLAGLLTAAKYNEIVANTAKISFDTTSSNKLANIEANADVTDATNVAAAGAVMESDTSTALMQFVIDEDTMVSNSATKVPTQQSVKAYVDGVVASGVVYKGAYNAATNSPDLDVSPTGVSVGDMYTVTVAGTFFTATVEVGDVLIAEVASASTEADWTIVQTNLDAPSVKTMYESNADTNALTDAMVTKLSNTSGTNTGDNPGVTSVAGTLPLSSSGGNTPTISIRNATNAQSGAATAAHIQAIEANSAKVSNVSTALSTGTVNSTTYGITSDGGTDDVILVSATSTLAGLLTAAKYNEIVANTAKVSNIATSLSTGTVTATTYGITSDGGTDDVILASATGTLAGLLTAAKYNEIVANTAKVSNVTTNLGATHNATTVVITSSDGADATINAASGAAAGIVTNANQTFGGTKTFAGVTGSSAAAILDSFVIDGGAF